ncbi:MAG: DUF4286 family protein [Bacteroidota bacterium]|nr:DUF4286 family protein [Bacteroidota bacterium]
MYIINQTFSFESNLEGRWKEWVQHTYIPNLLSHPDFIKNRMFKLISENQSYGTTYAVQFEISNIVPMGAAIDTFSMYNKMIGDEFSDKVVFFTTILKEV